MRGREGWTMKMRLVGAIAGMFLLMSCSSAQQPDELEAEPMLPTESPAPFSTQQLDQMLAPVALYPDPLIAQILMAATYPLEVVEADRWLQVPGNAALKGDELTQALAQQPWDPSIKSLVPFPRILEMMDKNLEWTENLGDAFLAQQAEVMDSIQRLRQRARAAGSLVTTPQQVVSTTGDIVVIEPAAPEVVYVPEYDPALVYGAWPWIDYPPYEFWPWPGSIVGFGVGYPIFYPYWGWSHWRWHDHRLDVDVARYNRLNVNRPPIKLSTWQHDPYHRGGVPYRDFATQMRYGGEMPRETLRASRGYPTGSYWSAAEHEPARIYESFGPGDEVRTYSQRGVQSMQGFYGGGFRGGGGGGRR